MYSQTINSMRRFLHLCLTSASVLLLAASCVPKLLISEVAVPEVSSSSLVSAGSSASSSAGITAETSSVSVQTKDSRVSVVTDTSSTVVTRSYKSGFSGTCDSVKVSVTSGGINDPSYKVECQSSMNKTTALQRQLSYTLKFGKRQMSGIIVAKPLADGSYRALGTTIFGMTVFDMTVSKDSYTMNSCAEFLENKAFASFLAGKIRKALY